MGFLVFAVGGEEAFECVFDGVFVITVVVWDRSNRFLFYFVKRGSNRV